MLFWRLCVRSGLKYALIVIVFVMGFLMSCCSKCPLFHELTDLEKPFGVESTQAKTDPQHFNVFIDASMSMYGYTGDNSDLFRIINTVISRIPNNATIKLYRFGRGSSELQGDLRQVLHSISNRKFYNEGDTDLNEPFKHILDDRNSINLIFTDGVQSTAHSLSDYVIFARNLKSYLGEHGFFSFKGTQASFEGYYYSEMKKASLNIAPGSTRPLYCLTFGDRKYAKFITDKFSDLFENHFDFGFVSDNKMDFVDNVDGVSVPKGLVFNNDDYDLPLTRYTLKNQAQELNFNLKGYEDSFGKTIDYTVAYMAKTDTSYSVIDDAHGNVNAEVTIGTDRASFIIPFPYKDRGCYLIRLTFRKTLPKWIEEWSTDDDYKIENQQKTFNLANWMGFIMDSFEDYKYLATTQYYLHVDRR